MLPSSYPYYDESITQNSSLHSSKRELHYIYSSNIYIDKKRLFWYFVMKMKTILISAVNYHTMFTRHGSINLLILSSEWCLSVLNAYIIAINTTYMRCLPLRSRNGTLPSTCNSTWLRRSIRNKESLHI